MPAKKARFTKKEDRQATHVAASEKKRGVSAKKAKSIGYATVNKMKSKKKGAKGRKKKGNQTHTARKTVPPNRRKRNIGRS